MKTFHVLVVDDDDDIRQTLLEVLEDEGFSAAGAADGAQALAYLDDVTIPPDLILLDLMMPTMDGFQFREAQLKDARYAGIPVAVITADERAKEKAGQLKASGFVRKPLSLYTLLEVVQQVLGSPRAGERG